jgi:hypothetical protein
LWLQLPVRIVYQGAKEGLTMTRMTQPLVLSVLLLFASASSNPAAGGSPKIRSHPIALAGTAWHTIHIDGDALFFLIDELGVRFGTDGRFVARVRFVDGQHARKTGTYRVKDATIFVTIDGVTKPKEIQFWTDGNYLIARDKAYDVTVRLAPGKMQDESWLW